MLVVCSRERAESGGGGGKRTRRRSRRRRVMSSSALAWVAFPGQLQPPCVLRNNHLAPRSRHLASSLNALTAFYAFLTSCECPRLYSHTAVEGFRAHRWPITRPRGLSYCSRPITRPSPYPHHGHFLWQAQEQTQAVLHCPGGQRPQPAHVWSFRRHYTHRVYSQLPLCHLLHLTFRASPSPLIKPVQAPLAN